MKDTNSQPTDALEDTPLGAMWRHRWVVLIATVLGAVLAMTLGFAIKSTKYEATASLVVTDPRTTTLFSADAATQLNPSLYVADQIAILQSDSVAQRATDLLAAGDPPRTVDATKLAEDVDITATNSNEIKVKYSNADETTAVAAVNSVIEAYELVRREAAVRESSSAIAQLEQSIANIDSELASLEQQIVEAQSDPMSLALNEQYQEALDRLVELQPRIATASGQQLDELRAERADIEDQLATYSRVLQIEADSPAVTRLYGEQSQAIARRSLLAEQRDRLLVDTELLSGGISLASPAQFARKQSTAISTITILGAFIGLLSGAAIAHFMANVRRRLTDRRQPGPILGARLLAEVPRFEEEHIKSSLPVVDNPHTVCAEAFRFAATSLDLQMNSNGVDPENWARTTTTFLVTSAGPGEGKTVLTANLALAAAREERRVLVIDADFGNQQLSSLLNDGEVEVGITEVVEAGTPLDTAIVPVGPSGMVDLLGRGHRSSPALEFWNLPASASFIDRVRYEYDVVLIDGPPLLHVAYASVLARYAQRVMVVVQHGSSEKSLDDLAQRLDLIGTPITGYVYNAAPLHGRALDEGSLRNIVGDRSSDVGATAEAPSEHV